MATVNMVQHSSHSHPLYAVDNRGEYKCNGCQAVGYGKSYRCDRCDIDLHAFCATCPPTLVVSHMHSHHLQLRLENLKGNSYLCDLCGEYVDGLFYKCSSCDLYIHPVCTQIPQTMNHDHLPNHYLTLVRSRASSACVVCKGECTSWRYCCSFCSSDVHLACVYNWFNGSGSRSTLNNSPRDNQERMQQTTESGDQGGSDHQAPRRGRRRRVLANMAKLAGVLALEHMIGVSLTNF